MKLKTLFAAALLCVPFAAHAAGSQSDDVSWTLPTQRVDGTPLPVSEIAQIEVEVLRDGSLVASDAFPPSVTSFTYQRELPPNYTLCYRARTVDTEGLVSDWTNEVCKIVRGKPQPPKLNPVK